MAASYFHIKPSAADGNRIMPAPRVALPRLRRARHCHGQPQETSCAGQCDYRWAGWGGLLGHCALATSCAGQRDLFILIYSCYFTLITSESYHASYTRTLVRWKCNIWIYITGHSPLPGFYIRPSMTEVSERYRGLAVRIEDDVLVTEEGCEVLSAGCPSHPDEVERLVRGEWVELSHTWPLTLDFGLLTFAFGPLTFDFEPRTFEIEPMIALSSLGVFKNKAWGGDSRRRVSERRSVYSKAENIYSEPLGQGTTTGTSRLRLSVWGWRVWWDVWNSFFLLSITCCLFRKLCLIC